MTGRGTLAVVIIATLAAAAVPAAHAQIPGPTVEAGAFDIGLGVRFINRHLEREGGDGERNPSFHLAAGLFRYGVNDWLTLTGEVGAANTHALEVPLREKNTNGRYLVVGVGVHAAVVRKERWSVVAGLHTSRAGFISWEEDEAHEREIEWLAALHARRVFRPGRHEVTVWGGPAYSLLRIHTFDPEDANWESVDNWGVIVGVEALSYSRVVTFAHVVYAEDLQPRVGAAVRFR